MIATSKVFRSMLMCEHRGCHTEETVSSGAVLCEGSAWSYGSARSFAGTLRMTMLRVLMHQAAFAPQHFLYFFPLPHGHGSLRPTFSASRTIVLVTAPASPSSPPCAAAAAPVASSPAPTARMFSATP